MDESCSIQASSSGGIKKNETTEVVSQKSNFKGSPQISLSFLNVKAGKAETLSFLLKETIREEYQRYYEIFQKGIISEDQKQKFCHVYEKLVNIKVAEDTEGSLTQAITVLCQTLYMYYGK